MDADVVADVEPEVAGVFRPMILEFDSTEEDDVVEESEADDDG